MTRQDDNKYSCRKIYEEYYKGDIPYSVFSKICYDFNKEIVNEMIFKKRKFNLGFNLGKIMVLEKDRTYKKSKNNDTYNTNIDWEASNKRKDQILKEGKIPLEMIKENNVIIGDNGGIPWIVFHDQPTVLSFAFSRRKRIIDKKSLTKVLNADKYVFKAMRANNRLLAKVKKELKLDYREL